MGSISILDVVPKDVPSLDRRIRNVLMCTFVHTCNSELILVGHDDIRCLMVSETSGSLGSQGSHDPSEGMISRCHGYPMVFYGEELGHVCRCPSSCAGVCTREPIALSLYAVWSTVPYLFLGRHY